MAHLRDLEAIKAMPTLCVGQDADLKVDKPEDGYRIWVNRSGPEDGKYFQVEIEELRHGKWAVTRELFPY